ncbi:retroviral-like aspartic protease family protein [Aquibacillus sp. 3ASR75-11]|uniref:Retroviral-like aspartic protease family protein n=1 Tax=Terrihalobacillus insolitus TaxID=2950438 RepID=A0A9X3WW54_9BACI|nr:retropepsin-like aspartic protease [Terrihalobacillus insolitus]MDC3413504.1 retroviral-like aspartic protease family protein [Terrihalobacillus insolitus]MDC3425206.1 retroviral-like aspartic protease family protein [Terrihalobacillus insolitus]
MKIKHKYGLLLVDITLTFNGKSKVIENMVVDTGAARTLISQDIVEDIGLQVELQDRIVTYFGVGGKEHAFRKQVGQIQISDFMVQKVEVDFNDFGYDDINGLLGLDLLMKAGFNIDLLNLEMNMNS